MSAGTKSKKRGKAIGKTENNDDEMMLWFKVPPKIYFKRGALDLALRVLKGRKRAFIVTDSCLFNMGAVDKITRVLQEIDIEYQIFFDITSDTTFATIRQAMAVLKPFEPDVIIALGGGAPIDAAKVMRLLYEQPDVNFEDISVNNLDIHNRICKIPDLGKKSYMVAIPTTSGAGSEVAPFSVVTDEKTNIKHSIADYALTPEMAIIDPNFVDSMPKSLAASSGIDALIRAIESYSSSMSTNFTNSNSLESIKLIFRYLRRSYKNGSSDPIAREKMHYAASISGMSFANSFLGLCHSMALALRAKYDIHHGIANALLIRQIIKYNIEHSNSMLAEKTDKKTKYAQIANELGLGGKNNDEKAVNLIKAIEDLMSDLDIPKSIKELGVDKKDYNSKLDELANLAFHGKCAETDSAYPSREDIKRIYSEAFEGLV